MRRIIASFALLVSTFAVCTAQEMNVHVYSRLDANNNWPLESSTSGNSRINWGNSSLYLMTDGSISEKLSFDASLHFLSSDPASLYTNTLSCVNSNWLDWADFTYAITDSWSVSAGKQIMLAQGFEIEDYDVLTHLDLNSLDWNLMPVYQWGAKVAYAPTEESLYALQVTTSPWKEELFNKDYSFAINGQVRQTFGCYSGIYSANYITGNNASESMFMFTIGNQVALDNGLTATLDLTNKMAEGTGFFGSGTLTGSLGYSFLEDKLEVVAKGGMSAGEDMFGYGPLYVLEEDGVSGIVPMGLDSDKTYAFGGLYVHYNPLENLRVHGAVAYNNYLNAVSATVGVLYVLDFKLF